jgi:AhpC/TSA family protein
VTSSGGWPPGDGSEDAERSKRTARPYSVVVGVLFLAIAIFAGINALSNKTPGAGGLPSGSNLPQFAAPSVTGRLEGDANVSQKEACKVKGEDVIRICDYFDRPLVLTAWFSRCGGHCEPQLDRVESIRGHFPGVAFVGLDIRDPLDKARKTVLDHGWGFPMAVDRDGAVGALYSVGIGPTTFFAYPGGVLMGTALGELDDSALRARVRELVRVSKRRGRVRASDER